MSSSRGQGGEYSPIGEKENSIDSESGDFFTDSEISGRKTQRRKIRRALKMLLWIGQAILLVANIYGLRTSMKIFSREAISNPLRAPIHHVARKMFDERETTPYMAVNGSSNRDVDHKWNELLDIGAIKMNRAAKDRLPDDTAQVYGEELYAGILEFEHQLHCLNRIRRVFYGSTLYDLGGTLSNFTMHNDHCFQYLRQSIMCHADVEVMSMERVEKVQGYIPNFHVVKQCRDFEAIHQWARNLPEVDEDRVDGSRDPTANMHPPHAGHGV